MAAFGLVSPVVIIFALIGAVVASGARNRFTMMIGSGDMEGARGIYPLSLILGVGVSALVMAVVFFSLQTPSASDWEPAAAQQAFWDRPEDTSWAWHWACRP